MWSFVRALFRRPASTLYNRSAPCRAVAGSSAMFGLATVRNAAKPEFDNQAANLTHEHLLQQASSVAVNAASQLLTQSVVTLVNIVDNYKLAVNELMGLLEESQSSFKGYQEAELDDLLMASRARVNGLKKQLVELQSFLEYVEKMVVSTAETSFLAGAEYVSSTLSERLHSAKLEIDKCVKQVERLDSDLLLIQKGVILNTTENEHNKSNKYGKLNE